MHRVKGIFEQICSMRNLRLAAKEALRGKRWRLPRRPGPACGLPQGHTHRGRRGHRPLRLVHAAQEHVLLSEDRHRHGSQAAGVTHTTGA